MEDQNQSMEPMSSNDSKKKKDLGDHALKAGENVTKVSGKVATGVVKEILIFFKDLTIKSKMIFLILSIVLVLIGYFVGYQSGKSNANQDLKDKYEDAQEKLQDVRESLN